MEAILFWLFAGLSVAASLVTITRRSPLASALALAVALVAIAGLFALLSAHLLFILQILVYAGAIVVLIIFVIMLIDLADEDLHAMRIQRAKFGLSALVCAAACALTLRAVASLPGSADPVPPAFGTAPEVGAVLFSRYALGLEIVGLILLVGIIGAVVLAKKEG